MIIVPTFNLGIQLSATPVSCSALPSLASLCLHKVNELKYTLDLSKS